MGEAALDIGFSSADGLQQWPLRLAQQSFSLLLENSSRPSSFRIAALRASARTALSALSVDDRGLLVRWLALQLATNRPESASKALAALSAVDALLASVVRAQWPQAVASLGRARDGITVAA
jgi:hypothetical protein